MAVAGSLADCTARCRSQQCCQQLARALSHPVAEEAALAWLVRHCHGPGRTRDPVGRSLLHAAASRGLLRVLRWLLGQKDAPLNGKDLESGYSPLHRAAFHGQLRALVLLLGRGANIALLDNDGLTAPDHLVLDRPMHVAYERRAPLEAYLWGSNSNYNLGLGTNTARSTPDVLDHFRKSGTHLAAVSLGKFHTGFVTSSGTALTCGHGRGGRLGHGSETMQLLPGPVLLPGPCTALATGLDHTVFLCEGGAVLTCGLNTFHQLGHAPPPALLLAPAPCTARGTKALGVAAGRFHSLYWTQEGVYTWGLNAGQLGHLKGPRTVVQPKLVASLAGREGGVARAATSDGAVVVLTGRGDVLALYEYGTKKLGQRQHGVQQLQVTGGQLDPQVDPGGRMDNIDFKLVAGGGSSLTVFLLSAHGKISVWGEQRDNTFIPCLFSLSREVIVSDLAVSRAGLLVVSRGGEAWSGSRQQGRARAPGRQGVADLIKVKRLPHVHRAVSAVCDSKGRNFCVLQVTPSEALTRVPEVSPSQMAEHMAGLFNNVTERDGVQDVVCQVGGQRFPAHSFILASGSEALAKQIRFLEEPEELEEQEQPVLLIEEVRPEIFRLLLQFLYTKSCDLLREGASAASILQERTEGQAGPDILLVTGDPAEVSAYQVYSDNRNRKKKNSKSKAKAEVEAALRKAVSRCPLALLQEAGKALGVYGLAKVADCFRVVDGVVRRKAAPPRARLEFTYKHLPELQDVTIETEDGQEVAAHKCMLVARSDYFSGMFGSGWAEAAAVLRLPIPAAIVEAVVDYLYKDDCGAVTKSEDLDFVSNVLVVADQFLISRLKEICECQLTKMLTLKNAAEILQFSFNYLAGQLQESCMQFICLNLPALLETKSLELLDAEVFGRLEKFYQGSNPVFGRRRVRPAAGRPSRQEVEEEYKREPVEMEELEAAEAVVQVKSRQRRHSSGEKDRRSPRVRTASWGSSGSGEEDEPEEVVADVEDKLDLLSLVDFDIEELEEEVANTSIPICAKPEQRSPGADSAPRPERKARLSQKDRKRLSLEPAGRAPEPPPSPTGPRPGWLGWGAAPETQMANSPSLSEIMQMECKSPSERTKVSPTPGTDIRKPDKKASWKKLPLREETVETLAVASPPAGACSNPWALPVGPSPCSPGEGQGPSRLAGTFEEIMLEDTKQKETLLKVKAKPLSVTQIEERAIEELRVFYGADSAVDEVIHVTRVQRCLAAPPVWRRVNK